MNYEGDNGVEATVTTVVLRAGAPGGAAAAFPEGSLDMEALWAPPPRPPEPETLGVDPSISASISGSQRCAGPRPSRVTVRGQEGERAVWLTGAGQ